MHAKCNIHNNFLDVFPLFLQQSTHNQLNRRLTRLCIRTISRVHVAVLPHHHQAFIEQLESEGLSLHVHFFFCMCKFIRLMFVYFQVIVYKPDVGPEGVKHVACL
jgi:hypothetical protein